MADFWEDYSDESVRLMVTLPCIDVTAAGTIMATWNDPKCLADAAHAASHMGPVPSIEQSFAGANTGHPQAGQLPGALDADRSGAQHLGRRSGPLGCIFRLVVQKNDRNVAAVAAA